MGQGRVGGGGREWVEVWESGGGWRGVKGVEVVGGGWVRVGVDENG